MGTGVSDYKNKDCALGYTFRFYTQEMIGLYFSLFLLVGESFNNLDIFRLRRFYLIGFWI